MDGRGTESIFVSRSRLTHEVAAKVGNFVNDFRYIRWHITDGKVWKIYDVLDSSLRIELSLLRTGDPDL